MTGLEQLAVQMEQNRAMQRAVEKSTPIAYEERAEVPSLTERLATYGLRAVNAAFEFGTPDALAGGASYTMHVTDYFQESVPVNESNMPKGLRVHKYDYNLKEIKTTADTLPEAYKNGTFTGYFFDKKYHKGFMKIFSEEGYDPKKIKRFFKRHRKEKRVSLYRDGYLLLSDDKEENIYILPLSRKAIKKIVNL